MSKAWVPLKPRARCTICGKDCAVRVDGTYNRHHRGRSGYMPCPASGTPVPDWRPPMIEPDPSHSPLGLAHPDTWADPEIGERVLYYSKVSGVVMPAIVTCTTETYEPTIGAGKLKPPEEKHPHLKVLSPGSEYDEFTVPPGVKPGHWAPAKYL